MGLHWKPRGWGEIAVSARVFMCLFPAVLVGIVWSAKRRRRLQWGLSRLILTGRPGGLKDPFLFSPFIQPHHLLVLRAFTLVWTVNVWCVMFSRTPRFVPPFPLWSFYTIWTYGFLTVMTAMLTLYSLLRVVCRMALRGAFWKWYRVMLWIIYQKQMAAAAVVAVVFWTYIYPLSSPSERQEWLGFPSLNQHGLNVVFLMAELLCSRVPILMTHVWATMSVVLLYGWAMILRFGVIPSVPIDLSTSAATVVLTLILFSHLVFHALFAAITRLRDIAIDPTSFHSAQQKLSPSVPGSPSITPSMSFYEYFTTPYFSTDVFADAIDTESDTDSNGGAGMRLKVPTDAKKAERAPLSSAWKEKTTFSATMVGS
ncbi:unnamed protein product [Vitrella brassicaformis CCMP3155]|uniref:Uncharacterized protein n=1 Tax=Vitrella brassicaformis (strain CCMP3155) TaxID=1169540 RepID=A0A0G4EYP6_VITBC|nr:unnamed protein product [Vitrella brassicaformis CCMP3155]|mmetsp:Transcript_49587/g.124331  ORF Transcript_49587/g.124331 Transcript_49587/m.124331 type:complete len:370 (-) Transcript_49587:450-1559(-)|eukprot:CEM04066.1 unnamed protein product [Vitrella brassicaformis CCMP3155]